MINLEKLYDKEYRMNNLYFIVDKNGDSIKFKMNSVQEDVFKNFHNRNLILKARQLGMSTFAVLYILDEALFNFNLSAGICSYSLQHAQHIFKKIIGHALDNIPKELGDIGIIQRSAHEITFSNGSTLRVDTTLRGGTCQLVLVSEFGKTCARSPLKAEEIITGTLESVSATGRIIIESTGEGMDGYFSEMVTEAAQNQRENLSSLEYKLHFYPWFTEKTYSIPDDIKIDVELSDYFKKIEKEANVKLTTEQKKWYAFKKRELADKVRQEYPSTVSEAFLTSTDAYYYSEEIKKMFEEERFIKSNLYDHVLPVFVAMDIGATDLTAITFFQMHHGEARIIDYYEDTNKGIEFYSNLLLQQKKYIYNTIFLPHDSRKKDGLIVENSFEKELKRLFDHTQTRIVVLKRTEKIIGITNAKQKFSRCVFDMTKTKLLIDHLSKYRKKWSEQYGRYIDEPLHDIHSDGADSFRYACQAMNQINLISGRQESLDRHKDAVALRSRKVY